MASRSKRSPKKRSTATRDRRGRGKSTKIHASMSGPAHEQSANNTQPGTNPQTRTGVGNKAYTEEEDQFVVYLREEEGKNWYQICLAMKEKFPRTNRTEGSIQVRYSRSLKPGASSRPKASRSGLSKTASSSSAAASQNKSRVPASLGADNKMNVSAVAPAYTQPPVTLGTTTDDLPQTRSGKVNRGTPIATASSGRNKAAAAAAAAPKKAKATPVAATATKRASKKKSKAVPTVPLTEAEKALLSTALADISQPANWDLSRQGQPPMQNLKPRRLGTPTNKGKDEKAGGKKRNHDAFTGVAKKSMGQYPGPPSPRQILIEEMTEKERTEREAKRPKLSAPSAKDKDWMVMHPVELGKYTEDDSRVAWAMKYPGPFRVLEKHATQKDHVRLRALRPGELQIGPPNSSVGIWEWVGADTARHNLHMFENHPYGQNWILRSTIDECQRRVADDYYLVNGAARTC